MYGNNTNKTKSRTEKEYPKRANENMDSMPRIKWLAHHHHVTFQ